MRQLRRQAGFAHVVLLVIGLALIGGLVLFIVTKRQQRVAAVEKPTQFIQADFIDLSKIYSISKFRSAEGHDFSGNGETCRSMKHYFTPQYDPASGEAVKANKGLPPAPDGQHDIAIYSPVDGVISQIASERLPVGEQLYIVPDAAKQYTVRLFHVFKSAGIQQGTRVKAGQKIGAISSYSATDIAVEAGADNFVSYFAVMPDSLFAAYKARGVTSRDDLILTKAYRDAHPVPCEQGKMSNQAFSYPAGYDHAADDVHLSGYVAPPGEQKYGTDATH